MERCRGYNAEVVVFGKDIGESKEKAMKIAEEKSTIYINGLEQ